MKTTHPFFAAVLLALLALANCAGAQPLPDAPVQEKAGSDAQLRTWIARLHDSDYSKRNAAVQPWPIRPMPPCPWSKRH
jgi:hypothetical protein